MIGRDVVHAGPTRAGRQTGQLRFEEAAADLLTDYRVNGRRALSYVERLIRKALTPRFGGRRMASLSTADVRAYVDQRQADGAANATINRELAALKRMFTLAIQAGKLLQRPHIAMLKEHNVRRGFFEREQFESVRRHLPKSLQTVATFAYLTGWRTKSEILTLQWTQVDRAVGVVRLEPGTTKNREGRTFVFGTIVDLAAAIETQWTEHERLREKGIICPWVFHRSGKPINFYRGAWQTACRLAGCPGRIPHDFRRTAVRNLVRAGVPDSIAMKMTGHLTRSVFDRYDIVSESDLTEASRKLNVLTGTTAGTLPRTEPQAPQVLRVANGREESDLRYAGGGNRTHTGGKAHKILSLARLPVSPLRLEEESGQPVNLISGTSFPFRARRSGQTELFDQG